MYVHVADQTLPCFQGLSSNLCRCTVDACFVLFYIYFSRAQFCEIYIYIHYYRPLYIFRSEGYMHYRRTYRKAKKFALDRGESMSAAIWSDFESIVLSEIVSPFSEPQQDATILRLYNDIVYYSTAPFCIFFLPDVITFREKNYTQLHAKLQH